MLKHRDHTTKPQITVIFGVKKKISNNHIPRLKLMFKCR